MNHDRKARRRASGPQPAAPEGTTGVPIRAVRTLVALADESPLNDAIGAAADALGLVIERASDLEDARERLARGRSAPEILLVHLESVSDEQPHECDADSTPGTALGLVREQSTRRPGLVSLAVTGKPSLEAAVTAMRAGAADLIAESASESQVEAALRDAVERAASARRRDERVDRLRSVCRKLNDARHDITSQVSTMCNDLVDAYRELSDQIDRVSLVAEYNGLVRHELEIESLLRTTLEFVLGKTGPTNAAIYLPATSNEFSLGAYVNYDVPPESSDVLLDHLADILAPQFETRRELVVARRTDDLRALLGAHAHWLEGQQAVAFGCFRPLEHDAEEECLAVVVLFRDARTPMAQDLAESVHALAAPFAAQLSRVIHVHHRHLPKDQWCMPGSEGDDDEDLFGASEDGNHPFGGGPADDHWVDDADDLDQAA